MRRAMSTLKSVPKSSSFIKCLKADPEIASIQEATQLYESNDEKLKLEKFNTPRQLKSGAYQFTVPTKRKKYVHLLSSERALEDLELEKSQVDDHYYKEIVSGESFYHDDQIFPFAQAYAGFQFGQFAGQLGDGRVVNLFSIDTKSGTYELQLKGAGKTAFSRFADGKAVVRSSIREFIISESLNGIGIPSARALSISFLPGTLAQRDYAETCAVVTRFAPSWLRIGTFDLYRYRKDREGLRQLCDYIIENVLKNDLPEFKAGQFKDDQYKEQTQDDGEPPENAIEITDSTKYEQLYRAIVRLNAKTVAYWQVYGFLNGVLNTDNTSILGLSIDFGPFSFLDKFDPNFTPNHDDYQLRYSFSNQPSIIWWNLTRLGESLVELLGAGPKYVNDDCFISQGVKEEWSDPFLKRANSIIHLASNEYKSVFMKTYNELFGKRLGLKTVRETDNDLYAKLLEVLLNTKADYNQFFVRLMENEKLDDETIFLSQELKSRYENPEDKIDKEQNEGIQKLIQNWLKEYRERLLSENIDYEERYAIASKHNPRFTARNWILDEVIQYTNEDYENPAHLRKLLKMSSYPFEPSKWGDELKEVERRWLTEPDEEKTMTQCSCSS